MIQSHTVFVIHPDRVTFRCSDGRSGSEPLFTDEKGRKALPEKAATFRYPLDFIGPMAHFLGGTYEVIEE